MADKAVSDTQMQFRLSDDFVSRYANNVQVEATAFDAKLIFGVLDQSALRQNIANIGSKPVVEQHTAMSISWPEVKLLIFFLRLQLAGFERENGKVKVPKGALPPEPPVLPPAFDTPENRGGLEMIRKLRAEFLAELSDGK